MTLTWVDGAPLRVETDADNCPILFYWSGRRHRLLHIIQQWQVDTDWWDSAGRVWRDYTAAVTVEGLLCVFYHDLIADEWRLARLYD